MLKNINSRLQSYFQDSRVKEDGKEGRDWRLGGYQRRSLSSNQHNFKNRREVDFLTKLQIKHEARIEK